MSALRLPRGEDEALQRTVVMSKVEVRLRGGASLLAARPGIFSLRASSAHGTAGARAKAACGSGFDEKSFFVPSSRRSIWLCRKFAELDLEVRFC